MPTRGPANDEERLPWLEPYRETIAHKARVARRSHGGLVAVAAGLAVLFAAGGGYWLGQRPHRPAAPSAEIAVAPVAEEAIAPPAAEPAAQPVKPSNVQTASQKKAAAEAPRKVAKRNVRQRKIRNAGIESNQLRAVRAAQERKPPPPPVTVHRAWPKMPSPGPAGQVIQLGAFKYPSGAARAYRNRLARYPLLARMPRVVVPVITKPRGQILYVLRLGTTSRQQSATVCRNLRASGDHCLVIG